FACADSASGVVDGLEAGGAEAVDGDAAHFDGKASEEDGHAGHVAVVLASLVSAAEDDVLDAGGIDAGAGDKLFDDEGGEVVGADVFERASVAAHGRAE